MVSNEIKITAKFVGETDLGGCVDGASLFIHINASLLQNVRHLQAVLDGRAASEEGEGGQICENCFDAQLENNKTKVVTISI